MDDLIGIHRSGFLPIDLSIVFNRVPKNIKPTPRTLIIGAGGVGTWVAQSLSMLSTADTILYIVDDDIIEGVNFNRLWYSPKYIGIPKAVALCTELVLNKPWLNCIPITTRLSVDEVFKFIEENDIKVVVEGTDDPDFQEELVAKWKYDDRILIEAHYDGENFTLVAAANREATKWYYDNIISRQVGSGERGYRVTPSLGYVPMLLASIVAALVAHRGEWERLVIITRLEDALKDLEFDFEKILKSGRYRIIT